VTHTSIDSLTYSLRVTDISSLDYCNGRSIHTHSACLIKQCHINHLLKSSVCLSLIVRWCVCVSVCTWGLQWLSCGTSSTCPYSRGLTLIITRCLSLSSLALAAADDSLSELLRHSPGWRQLVLNSNRISSRRTRVKLKDLWSNGSCRDWMFWGGRRSIARCTFNWHTRHWSRDRWRHQTCRDVNGQSRRDVIGHRHVTRNLTCWRFTFKPSLAAWRSQRRLESKTTQMDHHMSLSLYQLQQMPDEADARSIIAASPSEDWSRPPGRPRTTWMKTIQQDLRSNNLSLDEAITVAQNRPL